MTLAEKILALEPPRGMGPASIMRDGWNEAIKAAAALARAEQPQMRPGVIDDFAALLWRTDAEITGVHASIINGRTREAFDDTSDITKERWRGFAVAMLSASPIALDASPAPDPVIKPDSCQPTDTTGPLGAEWMRERATATAEHFRDMCGECHWPEDAVLAAGNVANDIAFSIRAIPGPTEDDLDAAALARPVVRELMDALSELILHTHNCEKELTEQLHHVDFCGESAPLTDARAVLAKAKEAGK